MMKKILLASTFISMMTAAGVSSASAQRIPTVVGTPTFNSSTFLFTYGLDNGNSVNITLPFANYAPLASPTFTGLVTAPNLTLTGSQSAANVLASPTGAAGAPSWRPLVIGDVPGAAPLASPTFTGTVTTPNLSVTGSQPATDVFAAPTGAAGAPSWRPLVAADVPFAAPVNNTTLTGTTTVQNLNISGLLSRPGVVISSPNTITVPTAGSAPSGATQVTTAFVEVTTCSATQPVQLPAGAAAGSYYEVTVAYYPTSGSAPCTIYGPSGATMSGASANTPVTLSYNLSTTFRSTSPTAWFQ